MPTINPFACMDPPTVDTFAANVRMRYRQAIRNACAYARDNSGSSEELCAAWRARFEGHLGVAEGMANVLFDLMASDAYSKVHGIMRVRRCALRMNANIRGWGKP